MAYAFQKYIDEQKHLDTDELRHTMKPICHVVIQDFKGEEHKFCDKEQLCPLGKYRRPKKLMESEQKGFASVADMMEANKKAEEDAKAKVIADQKAELDDLKKQLGALATSFQSYIAAVHPPK
jgi:2-methylcitrate dehydratase PrpD